MAGIRETDFTEVEIKKLGIRIGVATKADVLDCVGKLEEEKMKVDELRKKAEEMGVDSMGKKEELIKRILDEEENVDEES